jgi:hypothetical protein
MQIMKRYLAHLHPWKELVLAIWQDNFTGRVVMTVLYQGKGMAVPRDKGDTEIFVHGPTKVRLYHLPP